MSVIITFMFEPAKLQMNWASASGRINLRGEIARTLRRRGPRLAATGLSVTRHPWASSSESSQASSQARSIGTETKLQQPCCRFESCVGSRVIGRAPSGDGRVNPLGLALPERHDWARRERQGAGHLLTTAAREPTAVPQQLPWVEHPFIYEINTWVWLDELGRAGARRSVSPTCPATEWDAIAALGFDAVWLMGVWERSPAGIAIALENDALVESFRRALPDFTAADVVGSPYCIRDYAVAAQLGGAKGLASAREALAQRGLKLILDFVPNHVAPDHAVDGDAPGVLRRAAATTTSSATRRRSSGSATACSPTAATRTSPPGPTSCS